MQDGEYAYEEDEVCIKRYKIQEKSRITAKMAERYIPVDERTGRCVPTSKPIERKIEIAENAIEKDQRYKQITNAIKIRNPRSLDNLTRNLHIEDEERLNEIMASDETITLVSDGGLKTYEGFGWVAAMEDEILMTCYGEVKGSCDQTSSYRSEATGMLSEVYVMKRICEQLETRFRCSIWSDNAALVLRMK